MGALLLEVKDLAFTEMNNNLEAIGLLPIAIGIISAGLVGFFSIRLALKIVREHSLLVFALYTGLLGILILIDRFGTNYFFG